MTNKIALTASMRSNLLSLKNTQSLLDKTQDRLSTGYKVNSAIDNPSSYFTAQALNSRATDLSTLLDSIGQAISTLEVADQGITTLQSFVEQAKSVANSARDSSNVASKAVTDNVRFDPDNARTDLVSDYVNVKAGPANRVLTGAVTLEADDTMADLGISVTAQPAANAITVTVGEDSFTFDIVAAGAGNADDIAVDDTVQKFMDKVVAKFGEDRLKAEVVDGNIKFTTLDSSEFKLESARTTESHSQHVLEFSDTDLEDTTAAKVVIASGGSPHDLVLNVSGMTASTLTAAQKAQAYADAVNAAVTDSGDAAVKGLVATVDGTKVILKDYKEGNTSAPVAHNQFTGADTPPGTGTGNGAAFHVEQTGTSVSERLGFTLTAEGAAKPGNSFAIRLGDSTKITGDANLRADKTLEEMGMVDGQTIDIIVGDDIHTYEIGDEAGQISKSSTVQEFMDDIVYDIGRTKIKAELVDGKMSISTLDNSSLFVRSSQQTEDHAAKAFSEASITGATSITSVSITPVSTGAQAINIDLSGVDQTGEAIAAAINADAGAKAAGIAAEINTAGNLIVYDKTVGNKTAMTVTFTATAGAPTALTDDATKTVVMEGTSFNELVGFKPDQKVEVTDDMTVEDFRQAINNLEGVSADFDTKGHLVISGEQGDDLVMVNTANSNVLKNLYGSDVVTTTNGSNERAKYAQQFDNILTQIDELVQDTSYKGINLLNGDSLLVNFNESRTSSLDIKGVTFDSVGLGFTRSSNDWISNDDIDNALNQISKATSLLRAQASEFGQNLSTVQIREDFTQNMINNLQSGADKLTLADMNEEAANMLALQTRQQLGVNSLSLASQASQSVLKLF